jgi:anaphase-promoting complex subunit 1
MEMYAYTIHYGSAAFGFIHDLSEEQFLTACFCLQLALTYNEALLSGRLITSRGGIVQSKFIGSVRKRVDELLNSSPALKDDFRNYLNSGRWPIGGSQGEKGSILLSWYLQWFGVPTPSVIKIAVEKIKPKLISSSLVPFLRMLFPSTHIIAIGEIDESLSSCQSAA